MLGGCSPPGFYHGENATSPNTITPEDDILSDSCMLALHAVELLVDAYRLGEERGGSIDWSDLDQAHAVALQAVGAARAAARTARRQ